MNYEELILNAFEKDLVERRSAGASDVVFSGDTAQHRTNGNLTLVPGIPTEVLAFCVRVIFGAKSGATSESVEWRGYQMSAVDLMQSLTPLKIVPMLTVRLAATTDN